MTIRNILSVVVAVAAVITMASCGTSRNYPDRRDYPTRYPYPDGRYPYPDGRSYPTARYPNRLPPGQAKKIYGYKSAEVFAPGHNKYHGVKKHKKRSYRKY